MATQLEAAWRRNNIETWSSLWTPISSGAGSQKAASHYLRLANKRLGLLINFHAVLIKDGITRIVSGLEEENLAKPHDATV